MANFLILQLLQIKSKKNENLKIQYSIYGNEWKTYKITNAKFIRLVNTSTTNQTAKIEQFDIVFE